MNDIAENYIKLIDTISVDRLTEITNRAAWDDGITDQEFQEIFKYAVLRGLEVNEMYKLDFYTAISDRNDPKTLNHFERVSGYGQVVRTPRGREIEFGFDKRSDGWYVTDVASGMRIPKKYDTRMKALAALNAELLGKVDKAVESNTYKAVMKALNEFKTNSEIA